MSEKAYKTVKQEAEASFIEKKSEFIGKIRPVETEEEALAFIDEVRSAHRKATHNCFAYILRNNNIARHSDDGEPSGTAGAPIRSVIEQNGLTDVCIVVTRYFGGILLGAGGLVRAYTKGAAIAAEAAGLRFYKPAAFIKLAFEYPQYGRLPQFFADYEIRIQSEDFTDEVVITLCLPEEQENTFTEKIIDYCSGRINVQKIKSELYDFG